MIKSWTCLWDWLTGKRHALTGWKTPDSSGLSWHQAAYRLADPAYADWNCIARKGWPPEVYVYYDRTRQQYMIVCERMVVAYDVHQYPADYTSCDWYLLDTL